MEGGYIELRSHILHNLREKFSHYQTCVTIFSRVGYANTDTMLDNTIVRYTLGFNFRPTESLVYKFELS